jgi:hypothetical protein
MTADELQALKNKIGWYDQYDQVVNKQTGVRLLAIQLIQNKCSENTAWIPNQSQIQVLINRLQPSVSLIVEDFEDWYNDDKQFYETIPSMSFDILYLMYYMERYNRKFWCWGCGFWKDISQKENERKHRNQTSKIISYKSTEVE